MYQLCCVMCVCGCVGCVSGSVVFVLCACMCVCVCMCMHACMRVCASIQKYECACLCMCQSYHNSLASAVRPAMATATWSSIGKIFFWWADNSEGARCSQEKGRHTFMLHYSTNKFPTHQKEQKVNWSETVKFTEMDTLAIIPIK